MRILKYNYLRSKYAEMQAVLVSHDLPVVVNLNAQRSDTRFQYPFPGGCWQRCLEPVHRHIEFECTDTHWGISSMIPGIIWLTWDLQQVVEHMGSLWSRTLSCCVGWPSRHLELYPEVWLFLEPLYFPNRLCPCFHRRWSDLLRILSAWGILASANRGLRAGRMKVPWFSTIWPEFDIDWGRGYENQKTRYWKNRRPWNLNHF